MNKLLLFGFLALAQNNYSQCPFSVSLDSTGNCVGSILGVNTKSNISQIIWYNGATVVKSVTAAPGPSTGITVAGGTGGGSGASQLSFPQGIFVDAAGNLYVVDENNSRVQKWAPGATSGVTVAGGNGMGPAANQFNGPAGIWVDAVGNIYLADYGNFRIQKWAPGATSGITVAGGNGSGSAANQFDFPVGICVDNAGNIYVADNNNNRVQKWAPGATTGITVAGGNGGGSAANELYVPEDVVVDASGNIYITDQYNFRVQKWAPGATSGITVAGGNGGGSAANQLSYPYGLYVDAGGNVYVGDADNNRVQKWTPGATSGITVAGGNGGGSAANQLLDPRFVFVSTNGDVYVSEDANGRVQKWIQSPVIDTSYTTMAAGIYTAVVTDDKGCTVTTGPVNIYASTLPAITITSTGTTVTPCGSIIFNTTSLNGGNAPSFQWQVNNVNKGNNTSSFKYSNWQNGDVVRCIMTSNSSCATPSTATSNSIPVIVTGQSFVTLAAKGGNCLGDTLFITTRDSLAQIIWYNGNNGVDTVKTDLPNSGITVAGGNGIGYAANQIYTPGGIHVDGAGNIFVVDEANHRIQKWAPGATSGVTVAQNTLANPVDVVFDADGYMYVSDISLNSVIKFPPGSDGTTAGVTVAGGNGFGSAANQFRNPLFIFVDAFGYLYVIDQENERVQKFPPGSTSATDGITVATGLAAPVGIFVDVTGNLYISEAGYSRVQKWVPGATSGVNVAGGNGQGAAPNQLNAPGGIYVDSQGNVYVSDEVNNRVQKWAPGATTGITVAGGNGEGFAANQVSDPEGLYVDANGNIYVSDFIKNSVQKWAQQYLIDTTYKPVSAGTYTTVVTNGDGCTISSNPIVINPTIQPGVSIISSSTSICTGGAVTFTATAVNGGSNPVYQWQVNGINIGNNNPIYTSNTLSNGSKVKCILTSNALCTTTPMDTSNTIVITVSNSVTPAISITASQTTICPGTTVTFTAVPVNTGNNPSYQWQVNGNNAGTNSSVFATNNLVNGDAITCKVTGNLACVITPTATSNSIRINVNTTAPSVSISSSATELCAGDPVTFSAAVTNANGSVLYQWQVNGINAGNNLPTYTSDNFSNGDVVECTLKSNTACSNALSNSIVLVVHALPVVKPGSVSISQGQSITLSPVITGDVINYLWSPSSFLSSTSVQNPVASPLQNITYTLQVTSAEGCSARGNIIVKVYTQIALPNAFTPNGDGRNDIFYMLGGQQGNIIEDFSIFNRWGELIFHTANVIPGDPGVGWNGTYKGNPVSPGTYVYYITMAVGNGKEEVFKGIVELIR